MDKKSYFLKRLLFIPITLLGIMTVNFLFVQIAPGGPVEQMMTKITASAPTDALARISGSSAALESGGVSVSASSKYRGAQGLNEELRQELEKQFGFDKPAWLRFLIMVKNYALFDFGKSFYQDKTVISLILERMPVSISLGVFSTLLIYLIAIPLGIRKAVRHGSKFDIATSWGLTISYAVPAFLLAIFLIIVFAGGRYLSWFPLKGLTSDGWENFPWYRQILDYLWHLTLPVLAMTIGGLASLCFLTKNAFLDELGKNYVRTAKAKGLNQRQILYGHVFRNAMLIVIAGFPAMLVSMLFTGSVLIEVIFSLNGLGLLGFEAVQNRDYPVVFGTLYLFALLGLVLNLISDFVYTLVDPRIHFDKRKA
ncbi:MAG: microcin C ABC transporter permease YejB [Alphaproteobacteria bacterium]|nr:microcin C ABC transporter permease YejB [Alphaproteobacteria bacterium]